MPVLYRFGGIVGVFEGADYEEKGIITKRRLSRSWEWQTLNVVQIQRRFSIRNGKALCPSTEDAKQTRKLWWKKALVVVSKAGCRHANETEIVVEGRVEDLRERTGRNWLAAFLSAV